MRSPVVLDLETKYTFREFSDHKKLEVSVAALYDYATDTQMTFLEDELPKMFPHLEHASYIVGFNIVSFDLPVLSPYYPGDTSAFSTFDILDDIRSKIGHRIGLNDAIHATLDKKKTGHGLMAIDLYKEKKWEELKKYCMDDVMLTKALFDYGVANGRIYYLNERGKVEIPVSWSKYMEDEGDSDVSLTLPF